ncbi:MAG: putative endonuclease [Phycisphaerales bacterium]
MLLQSLFSGTNNSRSTTAKRIGNLGEQFASKYLKLAGWTIISRNLHFGHDELDILALDPSRKNLVIIEVRTTASGGAPEQTVTHKKRSALSRIARALKSEAQRHNCRLRVDVITIRIVANTHEIRHFEAVTIVQNI